MTKAMSAVVILTGGWCLSLSAGVVGDYQGARNLPGHIGLERVDDVHKVHIDLPKRDDDGFEHRTASQILREDYLRDDGTIDAGAIDIKIAEIADHERVAYMAYCVEKLPKKAGASIDYCRTKTDAKLQKKWQKKKISAYYRFAISELQKAKALAEGITASNINNPQSQAFLEHLFQGLETYSSIEDHDPLSGDLWYFLKHAETSNMVVTDGRVTEAANLVIPEEMKARHPQLRDRVFFAPWELKHYKLDSSQLDPQDSGFWRKPHAVRDFNTSNYNGMAGVGEDLTDPDREISMTLTKGGGSGGSPKIRAKYDGLEWKLKYLSQPLDVEHAHNLIIFRHRWRRYGHEVNTETVVNNLASALGFTVDPTYFKKSVRLYIPMEDPTDAEEFNRVHAKLVEEQGRWLHYDQLPAFSDIHTDEQGRYYIRMQSVALEKRSHANTDLSVGAFNKVTYSRAFKREFRAFMMFAAWVSDHDYKDDNGNLILVSDGAGGYKVAYSTTDMGFALGSYFTKDAVNFFGRDMVKRVRRRPNGEVYEVELHFRFVFRGGYARKVVSLADARWFTRLLVQLSPDQIRDALRASGYPAVVGEYYAQLLLRRRDQLAEAFGIIGETIVDGAGNQLIIKKESEMTDPKNYAVAGYEEFFRKGYLYDPHGELDNPHDFVRRHYDRTFTHFTQGTLQQKTLDVLVGLLKMEAISRTSTELSRRVQVTNRTFGLPLIDGGYCENECYYEGLRVGISNFLPMRYLLKNPYGDKDKPLLIADVYRFGFLLGADIGEDFPQKFGIDAEIKDGMPALRFHRVFEFIKVKPVSGVVEGTKNLRELSPLQILNYRRIKRQLVEGMAEGEALISSSYIVKGMGVEAGKYSYPLLGGSVISAGADAERITVSRSALLKSGKDKFVMQFSDLAKTKLELEFKGDIFVAEFPILVYEMQRLTKHDLLFEFELNDPNQLDWILENINRMTPSHNINQFKVVERSIMNFRRKFSKMLFIVDGFFDTKDVTTIEMNDGEREHELHLAVKKEEEKIGALAFAGARHTVLESFVTRDEQVFARLSMDYSHTIAKREHFAWVYENMLPLLGKEFILFTPENVGYYHRSFGFSGEVYVLPAGIEKILGENSHIQKTNDLCVMYATAEEWSNPSKWCEKYKRNELGQRTGRGRVRSKREVEFRKFARRFRAAQEAYRHEISVDVGKNTRHRLLREKAHKIAQLFATDDFNPSVMHILQTLAGEENIYRYGVLRSRFGALPGQSKEIEMPLALRGGVDGDEITAVFRDIVQSVEIYTDPLYGELRGTFYEPMGEDIIPELQERH